MSELCSSFIYYPSAKIDSFFLMAKRFVKILLRQNCFSGKNLAISQKSITFAAQNANMGD